MALETAGNKDSNRRGYRTLIIDDETRANYQSPPDFGAVDHHKVSDRARPLLYSAMSASAITKLDDVLTKCRVLRHPLNECRAMKSSVTRAVPSGSVPAA